MDLRKVYRAVYVLDALVLAGFLALLAWDNHERLIPYNKNFEGASPGLTQVGLSVDTRTSFSAFRECRDNKPAFLANIRKLIAYGGLTVVEEGYSEKFIVKATCSGSGHSILGVQVATDSDRYRIPTYSDSDDGYTHLIEFLGYRASIPALKEEDKEISDSAVAAIATYGHPWVNGQVIPPLIEYISTRKSGDYSSSDAYMALANLVLRSKTPENVDKALPVLIEGMHESSFKSAQIIYALGELRDPRAIGPLMEELGSGNCVDGGAAAGALQKIDPDWRSSEQSRTRIAAWLADMKGSDPKAQESAVAALGLIGGEEAVDALIAALADKTFPRRNDVARALGTTRSPRAIGPLIEALYDTGEDGQVAFQASRFLPSLTKQDFGDDKQKWSVWWRQNGGAPAPLP